MSRKQGIARLVWSVILVATIVLATVGLADRLAEKMGLGHLNRVNAAYLDEASERSMQVFFVLSAIKVGLAVVEGSEVGVGFGLELGDVVQAAYDYVDITWKMVLAGTVILQCMRFALASAAVVDQWFLAVTLFAILMMYLCRWGAPGWIKTRRAFRDSTLLLTVITLTLYLVLPLSIAGGARLSNRITRPSLEEARHGLVTIQNELSRKTDGGDEGILGLLSSAKAKVQEVASYVTGKMRDMAGYLLTLIAVYIFDCLVFPLVLFIGLLWCARVTARYLVGVKQNQNMREDLETILTKFAPPIRRKV